MWYNKIMDRRQEKTRDAIFKSFASLLAEKNYNKISVQEIINNANVGRTTFYAHFETKDDLLQELCNALFDHVFSKNPAVDNDNQSHNFDLGKGNSKKIVTHIIYHLQDSKKSIKKLFLGESKEIFITYFRRYLDEMITKYILKGIKPKKTDVPKSFLRNHISSAFISMIEWWISGGMTESPEELCNYFFAVIDPIL